MGRRLRLGAGWLVTILFAAAVGMIAGCGLVGPKPCEVLTAQDVAAVLGRHALGSDQGAPSTDVQVSCRYTDANVSSRYSFHSVALLTLITDADVSEAQYTPGSPVMVPGAAAARLQRSVEPGDLATLAMFRGHREADVAVVALGQPQTEQERQLRELAALVVDRWLGQ